MKTSTSKSFFKTTTFIISLFFIVAMQSSLQAQCADSSPTGDCDGDLIANQDDLDDDNDGILDSVECPINMMVGNTTGGTGSFVNNIHIVQWNSSDWANGYDVNDEQIVNLANGDVVTLTVSAVTGQTSDWGSFSYGGGNGGFGTAYPSPSDGRITMNTNGANGTITFNVSVVDVSGNPKTIDVVFTDPENTGSSVEWAEATTNGSVWTAIEQFDAPGGNYSGVGSATIRSLNNSTQGNSLFRSDAPSQLTLGMQSTGGGKSALMLGIFVTPGPTTDTDGDGILDCFDTDSDNDGCPDALEGDGAFDTDDLDGDNSLGDTVETDATSAAYGVPTAAGTGQATTAGVIKATEADIDTAPTDQTAISGNNATFTTVASATSTTTFTGTAPNTTPDYDAGSDDAAGLRYQWQEDSGSGFANITNGGIYGGATTASLTLTGVTVSMNGHDYKVIVTHIDNDCIAEEASAELTVDNKIIANNDDFSATPVDGTNGGSTATVFTGDTIEAAAFADTAVNATITDNDGITGLIINADGTLTVPANTDGGTYSVTYQICEAANTGNCDTAVVDLVIEHEIVADDDDFSATPVDGTNGGNTATVFTDDTLDGAAFANADVIPTITDNDGISGLTINADGTLTVPANTDAGTYSITYQICEAANTGNCDTAVVDLVIEHEIIASDDDFSATPVDGTNGGSTATVFTDDTLDGAAFANADVIPTITDNDGITGLVINADGTLNVPANTDAGTYSITYQICEAANTGNCDTATVDIVVEHEIIADDDDFSATPVDGTNGGNTASVFTDDTLDGAAFANADVIPTITDNDGITGLTINADGTLTVPANTTEGTYSITYQICEAANTGNCDTATVQITIVPDSDNDGVIDTIDLDDDNDGILDITENGGTIDPSADDDNDGIPNYKDSDIAGFVDNDSNGINDNFDADGDGVPNHFDLDADNDGIYDVIETGGSDADQDGRADDDDNNVDNTATNGIPTSAGAGVTNPTETTTGTPDYLNLDSDGDGCSDANEAYNNKFIDGGDNGKYGTDPLGVSPTGLVNGAAYDTGAVAAVTDGGPGSICNPDTDNDGIVDTVDLDDDNDGILDTAESGGNSPSADEDGDGIPNWNDTTDDGNGDGSTTDYTDSNADGVPDVYDFDGDGVPNHLDLDADNDGIYDVIESDGTDANNDGRADDDDNNVDNSGTNGIPTSAGTGILNPRDTGNNNSPDYLNTDSDGDGCVDSLEAGFADDNDDGLLGDAPIAVDANGVVTSSPGYTAPTETNAGTADYTDNGVNSCASISVTKTATLVDTNTNGRDDAGDTINYTFVVENTGTVDLTDVRVTDALATVTPATTISLAAGAMDNSTYTATYVLQQDDLNNGSFSNTAVAEGRDPGNTIISDTSDDPTDATDTDLNADGEPDDPTVLNFTQEPSISLLKTGALEDTNADGFPNAGEQIRYSFTVENTGNVTLTGISITDPLVTVSGGPIDLEPGATNTTTFFALYTLTQADVDNGSITNAAVVTGQDPNNTAISDNSDDPTNNANVDDNADGEPDDDTVIDLPKNPSIEIFKTGAFVDTNANGIGELGETIGYIFDVRNTGNVTLSNITISDPLGTVSGGPITLEPGETDNTSFTFSYSLTQPDIDAGEVINRATVNAQDPDNAPVSDMSDDPITAAPEDDTVVTLTNNPAIALFKTSIFNDENGDGFANAGETITYNFDVRNVGNVTLNNVQITDPNVTVNGGPITLAPATFDDTTFSATYTLTQADVENGTIENQAEVTSEDSTGNVIGDISDFSDDPTNPTNIDLNGDGNPDDPTVTDLPADPSISLEKVGVFNDENNDGFAQVGETMSYTFRIENTGNIALNNVSISDPIVTVNGGPIATMAPGAIDTGTFTATYAITQANIDAGEVLNLATVTGRDGNGDDITDDSDDPNEPLNTDSNNDGEPDDPTIIATPQTSSIRLTKAVDSGTFANLGDVITYNLVVNNTGNTTLSNIVVTDNNATITSGSPIASLAPGTSAEVTATYTIQQADMNAEEFTNVAQVSGQDPMNNTVQDTSDDPNNMDDVDANADGEPDDPTIIRLDSDQDGIPNTDDLDDDNDGITDIEEQNGFDFLDTDNDGIVDRLDIDADGDGINDVIEAGHGIADTDGDGRLEGPVGTDGIPDSVQNDANGGTVTYTPRDTDGDGRHDFQDVDDDGDGVLTSQETIDGTDYLDQCDLVFSNMALPPEPSWNDLDCDGDGVINGTEISDGTDPTNACDFMPNSITVAIGANANANDCDGDGVTNEQEVLDGTDAANPCDFILANATELPSDAWNNSDCDGDGVTNEQELITGTLPLVLCDYDLSDMTLTPSDIWNATDCDGDNIPNARELDDGTDPNNDCSSIDGTPLPDSDCDDDGLTNQEESDLGTNPDNPDTDGDGILDGQEVLDGTPALDPCISIGGTPPPESPCGIEIENELMTPDGDGINDSFRIRNIDLYPTNTVEIFNRWGVKVFSTTGYDNESNAFVGISNGRVTIKASETLPAGVYFYVINYNDNGQTLSKSGYLYINQ